MNRWTSTAIRSGILTVLFAGVAAGQARDTVRRADTTRRPADTARRIGDTSRAIADSAKKTSDSTRRGAATAPKSTAKSPAAGRDVSIPAVSGPVRLAAHLSDRTLTVFA